MGRVGSRQKTAEERRRDGSRTRPHHSEQPTGVPGEPVKPGHLSQVSAAQWDILAEILRGEQRLHLADGQQLENAAHLYAMAVRWQLLSDETALMRIVEKPLPDGNVATKEEVHPCHQQARLAWDTYRKACAELGITQTSRSRAKGITGANDKKEPTPLEKLRAARAAQRELRAV
jgi:phage terminase small subunit